MKVAFIAKTDLSTDGRILNQMRMLNEEFKSELNIHFILFPDKPFVKDKQAGFHLHTIHTFIRNNRALRFLTVIEFTIRSFFKLVALSPDMLHVQDSAVILPALLYKGVKGKGVIMMYDDHELPNENPSLGKQIFNYFERLMMQSADFVLFANNERLLYSKEHFALKTASSYFLNLPFYDENDVELTSAESILLGEIDLLVAKGNKFIIHQGVINKERGELKLANFVKNMRPPYRLLIIGANRKSFDEFVEKHALDESYFYFVGKVRYHILSYFWKRGIASVVMYLPTYINNKLCAPNRFYISLNLGLPVFVNNDNPVLNNLIREYKCGYEIENVGPDFDFEQMIGLQTGILKDFDYLKEDQVRRFLEIYQEMFALVRSKRS